MATVAENLQTLIDIKDDIKSSIIAKGVPVADTDGFATYPSKIDAIQSGGGGAVKIVDGTRFAFSTFTEWPGYDTSEVSDFSLFLRECTAVTSANQINTSNATSTHYMFKGDTKLSSVTLTDTSNVTNMSYMFDNCRALITAPQMNTSSVTNMDSMFKDCTKLASVPLYDTSNVTNMYSMFDHNGYGSSLTSLPTFDTSKVKSLAYWVRSCSKLTEFPPIDTSMCKDFSYMVQDCYNMTTVPLLNMGMAGNSNIYNVFRCRALTTMGGLTDLGKSFSGSTNTELKLSESTALTVESVQNVGNTIYDLNLNSVYTGTATIKIATAVYNQLSPEDIALFTNKKWVLSAV